MSKADASETPHDPLRPQLRGADDRIRLNHWLPPQNGTLPHLRVGEHWVNVLWALPLAALGFACILLVGYLTKDVSAVVSFVHKYPGIAAGTPAVESGFPAWLRIQHFLNLLFMMFIMRSGLQILADHPRLYWQRDSTPGTEWFRFQKEVPRDRIWTAKDDSVTLPRWLGIPGLRHTIGLARWWHFSTNLFWVLNGIAFYVLLFVTDQWLRLVPVTWEVFPNAISTAIQYASLNFPADEGWTRYNSLQQLTYFITVFIAAPVSIMTGLLQGPAISNRLGWVGRVLNRQLARSIHFITFGWFVMFIITHIAIVGITGLKRNTNHMFADVNDSASWSGMLWFLAAMSVLAVAWWLASPVTIRYPRKVQHTGKFLIGWLKGLAERPDPKSQLTEKEISPFFWPNGTMPKSAEYEELVANHFTNYRLRVSGLVENPREFSLSELKVLPKQEQITTHFCIQGWSGVAKWGGLSTRLMLEMVKPLPEARYAVFYSLAEGGDGGLYYDVHSLENMRHELTLLAYEMNGEPLSVLHGAPLRLRCENELGFKMVKWIATVEFVSDYTDLGAGEGGYNEDHEFFGYRMPI